MPKQFELTIKGFTSKAQIEEFITWLCNSGEQDFSNWAESAETKVDHFTCDGNVKWKDTNGTAEFSSYTAD